MSRSKIVETFAKPVLSGVIAGAIAPPLLGTTYDSIVPGLMNLSTPVAVGLAVAVGTGAGTVAKDWVLPYIPRNSKFAESEGMLLTPVLSGAASTLILSRALDGSMKSYAYAFAIGAGSSMAGDYLHNTILRPYL